MQTIEFSHTRSLHMNGVTIEDGIKSAMEFIHKHKDENLEVSDFYVNRTWDGRGYDMSVTIATPRIYEKDSNALDTIPTI